MSYILIGIIRLSRVQTSQDQELLGKLFIVNPLALLHGRWGCYAPEKAKQQIAAVLT
jgi:hypothetical protein